MGVGFKCDVTDDVHGNSCNSAKKDLLFDDFFTKMIAKVSSFQRGVI